MLWAWNWPVTPTQKLVLIALAWHSDDGGSCWPSQARLARLSGLSERSIRRAARALEQQNLIRRHRRTTDAGALTSHLYVLQLERHPSDSVTAKRLLRNKEIGLGRSLKANANGPKRQPKLTGKTKHRPLTGTSGWPS